VPIGVDPDGNQPVHDDDATALADLDRQRIGLHQPIRPTVERAIAELLPAASRLLASSETWLLDKLAIPKVSASLSTRRVETPSSYASPTPTIER
jgi:hypothetical protein